MIAEKMPHYCGPNGKPRSWRHYVYAIYYIQREELRQTVRDAQASRWANADEKEYADWRRDMRMITDG
jgi:hypothetical protein